MTHREPVLELRDLTFSYARGPFHRRTTWRGTPGRGAPAALDGLALTVRRGDLYGFLGPNGAGKTTAIRLATRLIPPPRGRVLLFGQDLSGTDPTPLARIGAVVEGQALYPYLTALENLQLLGRLSRNVPGGRAEEVLARVGLAPVSRRKVGTFSLGMRMRLLLAAAVLHRPELVILDEPWNGLDPLGVREVLEMIRGLRAEEGMTFFLSSHQLHEVEALCDRVGLLSEGRLIVEGETAALLRPDEVVLEVRAGDPARARAALQGRPWCRGLGEPGNGALEVAVARGAPPLVARALVEAGLDLHEMREKRPTLEEFFHRHFGGARQPGEGGPAA